MNPVVPWTQKQGWDIITKQPKQWNADMSFLYHMKIYTGMIADNITWRHKDTQAGLESALGPPTGRTSSKHLI